MSREKTTLLLIKGAISECSPEQREKIEAAAVKFRAVLAEYPDGEAHMALGLVAAEIAASP